MSSICEAVKGGRSISMAATCRSTSNLSSRTRKSVDSSHGADGRIAISGCQLALLSNGYR